MTHVPKSREVEGLPFPTISSTPNFPSYQDASRLQVTTQAENPYGYYIGTIYDRMLDLDSGKYETSYQEDGFKVSNIL